MADLTHVQLGSPPWRPSEDAHLVETCHRYDRYDVPLVGVVSQHGVDYLFRCFYGHVELLNLWTYTLVDADDLARVEATGRTEEFDGVASELAHRGSGVTALAMEDHGVVAAVPVDDLADGAQWHGAVEQLFDAFDEWGWALSAASEGARRRAVPA